MLRYTDYDIVFREIPDETTLAVNLAGCPNRCPGCHSPQLQEPIGEPLTEEVVERLLVRYGAAVTCFCLMGGDAEPHEAARLALFARRLRPALRTRGYSGLRQTPSPPPIAPPRTAGDAATVCGQTPRERPNSGQTDERIGRFEKNAYLYALFYRIRRPKALCPASGN